MKWQFSCMSLFVAMDVPVYRSMIKDGNCQCNAVSLTLLNLTGTTQRVTSAYHPQANGLVERQNRTIQGSMLKVLAGEQQRWPDALQGFFFCFSHIMTQIHWSDTI